MIKTLKLDQIITDAKHTQVRHELDEQTINEYGDAAKGKAALPPLVVFDLGHEGLILADGFHRFYGMERQGIKEWPCDVRKGTRKDAVKFALGCNTTHGLRRTNEDKRNAAVIAYQEFPGLTDRALAEICAVSHTLIAEVRKQMEAKAPAPAPISPASPQTTAPAKRIGNGGKQFKAPVRQAAAPAPAPTVKQKRPGLMDATGITVPSEIIPYWNLATEEANRLFSALNAERNRLKLAQDRNEPMFREIDFTADIAHLDNAIGDLRRIKPYAVCPDCNGIMTDKKAAVIGGKVSPIKAHEPCATCKGRGFLSEYYWTHFVPEEIKITTGRA